MNKIFKIKYFEWKLMRITCLELRIVETSEWSSDWSEQHNSLCEGSRWVISAYKIDSNGLYDYLREKGSIHTKPGVKGTGPVALYSQLSCLLQSTFTVTNLPHYTTVTMQAVNGL